MPANDTRAAGARREPVQLAPTCRDWWPGEIAKIGTTICQRHGDAGIFVEVAYTSGYSCQRWGVAISQADGRVVLEPEPEK
jgi:hypothetical protein